MRIDSLKLTNFRSHQKTEFALNRVNIFRGPHGAGKSSIQKAIEYALTGRCDLTDARGAGAENLIHLGKNEMGVQLTLDGGAMVTRVRNRAGGSLLVGNGKQSFAGRVAEEWVVSYIGPADVLSSVFNSNRFCRMTEKEQTALLAAALASDPVAIESQILQLSGEVPKEVASSSQCDAVHKYFFDARADRKRELKAMGDLQAPEIPEDCPPLAEVTAQLEDLERQKAGLVQQSMRLTFGVTQANDKLRSEYVGKKSRLDTARRTVEEMGSWVIETSAEIASLQKKLKGRGEAEKLTRMIAENKAKQEALRSEKAKLSAPQQTSCPTCKRAYENIPDYSARLAEIEHEQQELIDALQKLQDESHKLPDFDAVQRRLDNHQMASPKVASADVAIKELDGLSEPEYQTADTSTIDTEIATLTERIAKGRDVEKEVVRLEEQRKQYESAKGRRVELEQVIAKLETLVQYFGPTGPIKAKLVGGKLSAFVERINQVLARFGFQCEFSLEPYKLTVELCDHAGPSLHLNQLSESEEYRFGVAFAVALAEATGVGVVVLDRGDILLPEVRATLTATLLDSNLDQILLMAAGEPMEEFPDVPGTTFFELENVHGETSIRKQYKSEDNELSYVNE